MPRKNGNHVHSARDGRRKSKKSGPKPLPIDWNKAERAHYGHGDVEPSYVRRTSEPATTYHNEFTRHLKGFSLEVLDLLWRNKFAAVDPDEGFVAVTFTGISQAPKKKIECSKPSLAKTRGGVLVLSSVVSPSNVTEIGNGSSPIKQVEAPELDTHNSNRRFNVALGTEPQGFDEKELASELAIGGSALTLSEIMTINGKPIDLHWTSDIEGMWNRPLRPSRYDPNSYGSSW